jgi:transcriptional regulator with XRE-family HTH domain
MTDKIKKERNYKRSKLGELLIERGITQREFAEMLFEKTGYLIATTNLSNICSGYRPIKKWETAQKFANALGVPLTDIL